jgi:hypothetical protein
VTRGEQPPVEIAEIVVFPDAEKPQRRLPLFCPAINPLGSRRVLDEWNPCVRPAVPAR